MITIFKSIEHNLTVIPEPVAACWLNVVQPTQEEIAQLIELGIPQDYITYSLDIDERARTEKEDGVLLILMRVSIYEGQAADIPYITVPLGIILTDHYIVTICRQENDVVQEMTLKDLSTVNGTASYCACFPGCQPLPGHLRQITKAVDALEDRPSLHP
jgi:magnesium transporter